MTLPDDNTEFGRRVRARLRGETVIWLTTTSANGTPQPNPVWFLWEEPDAVLVYNRSSAHRLDHVAVRPRVSLNFNSDADGDDVVVLTGVAQQAADVPGPAEHPQYTAKYGEAMARVSGSAEAFARDYPVPLRITVSRARGF